MSHAKRIDSETDKLGKIVRETHDQHGKWLQEYYGVLHLARIIKVEVYEDEHDYGAFWPRFHVILYDEEKGFGEKLVLEISQDEEGNGPGFIFGLPFPEKT